MDKLFAKGGDAFLIEKSTHARMGGENRTTWNKHSVKVKSSGRKFVTVTGFGAPRKFITTDKPVLLSEKGSAYLVGTLEHADKLLGALAADGA